MAETSPQAIPPAHPTAAQQRCEVCGDSLFGTTDVNKRCSPCFWARSQNQDPSLWKVNPEYEKCPPEPPLILGKPVPFIREAAVYGFDNPAALKALKYDDGKLPIDLLPFEALEEIALVLQYGANKYAPHNWRGGFTYSRLFSAMMRHMWAFWKGEDIDPESGHSHLGHAGCCLLFLISHVKNKYGTDNRYGKEKKDGSS